MVTLFASVAGFITSIFPEIIKYLRDKSDKQHELEMLKKQIEFSQNTSEHKLEEIYLAQDIIESKALYSTFKSGILWVDALNASVRPVLAYSFFLLYLIVKYMQYQLVKDTCDVLLNVEILWTVEDQAIFAGIISFYFGQRTINKMRRQ
jgi:hypothetical protein